MALKAGARAPHDPLQLRVSYLLRRVSAAMMSDLSAALTELELRPVEASMLVVIAANPGCKQVEIGRLLGIKPANMAPLVGDLVNRGLIAKTQVDGRSQAVVLTRAGKQAAKHAERRMDEIDLRVTRALGPAGSAELAAALTNLLQA